MSKEGSQPDVNLEHGAEWKFDEEVTKRFEDMLQRSIPQYDLMRKTVFDLGSAYVKTGTDIVDLGCSRGEALQPFVHRFGALNHFVGVDVSEPMLAAATERYKNLIDRGVVDIRKFDLRDAFPPVKASLILSILTLQFTPIEYRSTIVAQVYKHLNVGGAFIIVEKVLGPSASIHDLFWDQYLEMKKANGYTSEEIERKRLALEGVLVPITARWNEDLLRSAGFSEVDCFWRWLNFAGWIAVK